MKHYTEFIPQELAEKLKEVEMPIEKSSKTLYGEFSYRVTYAEVIDWLMEKGYHFTIYPDGITKEGYSWDLYKTPENIKCYGGFFDTWHESINRVIEFILIKIRRKKK